MPAPLHLDTTPTAQHAHRARLAGPRLVLLLLLVLAGAGLAACDGLGSLPGVPQPPDQPIAQPPVAPGGPPAIAPGEPPVAGGAQLVQPEPGIVDPRPHTWDKIEVAADGQTLTVYWYGGVADCYGLSEVIVERVGEEISVTVMEGTRAQAAGQACIAIAAYKATTVALDGPLFMGGASDT